MISLIAYLYQNLGTGIIGNSLNVSGFPVVNVSTQSWSLDQGDQLARCQAGDLAVEIMDPQGLAWSFLTSDLSITNGLLPPYLVLTAAGVQVFLGIIDPSRMTQHTSATKATLELSAQDWSIQLANTYLGTPQCPYWEPSTSYTVGTQVQCNGNIYQCATPGTSSTGQGPTAIGTGSTIPDGTGSLTWQFIPSIWSRSIPKMISNLAATNTVTGYSAPYLLMISNPTETIWPYVLFPLNTVSVGDTVTAGGVNYLVTNTAPYPMYPTFYGSWVNLYNSISTSFTVATLSSTPWLTYLSSSTPPAPGYYQQSFTVQANNTIYTPTSYYTVQRNSDASGLLPGEQAYPNTIFLDTIEGITIGDVLVCIEGSQSNGWTILSINPELICVTTKETVTGLQVGNRMFFDVASNNEIVMADARVTLAKACLPYGLDTSRLVQAPTDEPVLGWVPLTSMDGTNNLTAISDIQPSLTNNIVTSGYYPTLVATTSLSSLTPNTSSPIQQPAQYQGDPTNGWTCINSGVYPTLTADWTSQLLTAPSSLMPYEVRSLAPNSRWRNRVYHDFTYLSVDNGPIPSAPLPRSGWAQTYYNLAASWYDPWITVGAGYIPTQLYYDYLGMRKLTVTPTTNSALSPTTITTQAWTGSSWATAVPYSWPTGNPILSLSPFPGGPSGALLAYTAAGTLELALSSGHGGGSVSMGAGSPWSALPGSGSGQGYCQLVTTPYGAYVIGPYGYALVTYTGSVLGLTNPQLFPSVVTCFWPNTFTAIDDTECFMLGRYDDNSTGSTVTETWSFRLASLLQPISNTTNSALILSELLSQGAPTFAGAMRDPAKAGRVIGHYGGNVFQVDSVVPWAIERLTPSSLSALDCIEHICQVQGAMAVATPSGKISIISRVNLDAVVPLTNILVEKIDQTVSWDDFYSVVLTETQDGNYYADNTTGKQGGRLLRITGHPMVWRVSEAQAMCDSLIRWYGKPRQTSKQVWHCPDLENPAPWANLLPFQLITINGSMPYRLMAMEMDYIHGRAEVLLVQN